MKNPFTPTSVKKVLREDDFIVSKTARKGHGHQMALQCWTMMQWSCLGLTVWRPSLLTFLAPPMRKRFRLVSGLILWILLSHGHAAFAESTIKLDSPMSGQSLQGQVDVLDTPWILALPTTAIRDVAFHGPFASDGQALGPGAVTGLMRPYDTRPLGIERISYPLHMPLAG